MTSQPKLALNLGLLLPLAGAVLLVLAEFVPWLRVQYGAEDTLSSYYTGSIVAMPHLANVSLDGLPFWLTLIYAALLVGLAIGGLRVAATGWGAPAVTAKRLLLVSGLATLLMAHALFYFVSDLHAVDSISGSGQYSDRFNPGPGLVVGPLGALLALAGALVALGWVQRSVRAGAWLLIADDSADLVPAFVHSLLPAGIEDVARALLSRWRVVLTHPTRASFEPEVAGAGLGGAVANVGALVGVQVVAGLLCGTLSFGDVAADVVMTPVGFFLLAGVLFLVARGLGGDGSLAAHLHVVAIGWAPAACLASVALAVEAPFVSGLAGVALGGYGVYLAVVAMLAVHRIGGRPVAQKDSLGPRAVTASRPLSSPSESAAGADVVAESACSASAPAAADVSAGLSPVAPVSPLPQDVVTHACAAGHPVSDAGVQLCPQCGAAVQPAPLRV